MGRLAGESPLVLLANLAQVLNACAELNVKLKHGVVYTDAGYVLPIGDKWVARTLQYTPFSDTSEEELGGPCGRYSHWRRRDHIPVF